MERPRRAIGGHPPTAGWLPRERALALALLAATGLALWVCYLLAQPFLPALTWALALAIVSYPLHKAICRRLPRPNAAAILTVAIVVAALLAPAVFVSQQLGRQVTGVVEVVTDGLESGRLRDALARDPRLAPLARWLGQLVEGPQLAARAREGLESRAGSLVTGTAWTVVQLLVTVFALFYFVRDRRPAVEAVRALAPLSEVEMRLLTTRVADTVRAIVFGSLVVAAVQGTLGGLMFWLLGLPAPLLWGAVMTLLAIVPTLGAFLVWVPAAIFLAVQGAWGKALILGAWGAIAISFIDNLLYPALVGGRLRLHTLPVFLAIVGGLVVFGAAGVILGPVIFAVTLALVDIWRWRTSGGRSAERPVEDAADAGRASA